MHSRRTALLRTIGLFLCFLAFAAVVWTNLQMRFMAESNILISDWIIAAGYILCPTILAFGALFTTSYGIKEEKAQFLCLTTALSTLVVLLAGLFLALAIDYPRAVEAKENFGWPNGRVMMEQGASPHIIA